MHIAVFNLIIVRGINSKWMSTILYEMKIMLGRNPVVVQKDDANKK